MKISSIGSNAIHISTFGSTNRRKPTGGDTDNRQHIRINNIILEEPISVNAHTYYPIENFSVVDFNILYHRFKNGASFPSSTPEIKHAIALDSPGYKNIAKSETASLSGTSMNWGQLRPPFISKDLASRTMNLSEEEYNKQTRAYINEFVKAIQYMQQGNVVIQTHSELDLRFFDLLNNYFNPKAPIALPHNFVISRDPERLKNYEIDQLSNLYKNFNQADKEAMNWPPEFELQLRKDLKRAQQHFKTGVFKMHGSDIQ